MGGWRILWLEYEKCSKGKIQKILVVGDKIVRSLKNLAVQLQKKNKTYKGVIE